MYSIHTRSLKCIYHHSVNLNKQDNNIWKKFEFFSISDFVIYALVKFWAIVKFEHLKLFWTIEFPNDISYIKLIKFFHRLNRISTNHSSLNSNIKVKKTKKIPNTIIYSSFICSFLSRSIRPCYFTNFCPIFK